MRIGPARINTIVSRWRVLTAWCAAEAPDGVGLRAVNGAPVRGLDLRCGKRGAGPKFGDKLAGFQRSTAHAQSLPAMGVAAVAFDRRLRGLHGANDPTRAGMALDR